MSNKPNNDKGQGSLAGCNPTGHPGGLRPGDSSTATETDAGSESEWTPQLGVVLLALLIVTNPTKWVSLQ